MRQCLDNCFFVRIRKEVKQGLDSLGELLVVSLETWSSKNGISGLNLGSHNDEKKLH